MNSRDPNKFEIGLALKLTFALLIALILGGNGVLLWQFRLARLQTERLTDVNQELIGVLRLQVSLLSVHQRLDRLAQSRDAGGLANESAPLRSTLLEEIQGEMSTLARLPYETHVNPELQPTLQAIEITLPTQLEAINGLAASGDWKAVRLRLDNELEPIESLCASLVAGTDQKVSGELALAVANMRRRQLIIFLVVPLTAVSTFFVAAVLGWAVTRHIITLRMHERVEALRSNERNLTLIINTIPMLAWSAGPDGSVEFLNQRWLDFAGMTAEQAGGWGWAAAIHPDDVMGLMGFWQAALASGAEVDVEARMRRFDGQYRWFLFRADPLRDESGAIIKWYGTNTDIDDRKRAEEALRNTQAELSRMMRVMTIGQLTASIAHEVNQPLSGIITNASTCLRMLKSDPPNVDGARETVQRTIRDGNRASEVITRLRTLFSKKQIDVEPLDLNEAAREVITLLSGELQKNNVILKLEFNDLPPVNGDRVQLQQVILNLIRNGSDAMDTVNNQPRQLIIKTEMDGDHVTVSVQDSGVGFSPEIGDRLFESFFTTKQEGMGVGLSLSRSIVEAHRGRLWAASNDGPGATFAFSIPCGSRP